MIRPKRCKTHRKAKLHLRTPLVGLAFLAFALTWDGSGILRIGLFCAILHETGHLLMYRFLWGCWPDLQLYPFGIRLLLRGTAMTSAQELALAAAGPLTNLLVCWAILWWMRFTGHYCYTGYWFACTNLLVGGSNLLPLPGLDGARILCALFDRG